MMARAGAPWASRNMAYSCRRPCGRSRSGRKLADGGGRRQVVASFSRRCGGAGYFCTGVACSQMGPVR